MESWAWVALLMLAGFWAGAQNALAGGGSFVTLPALMLAGLDARVANLTSTIALFPAQVASGWTNRALVAGPPGLSFGALAGLSLAGGALGAGLLLLTPSDLFRAMLPWLVLVATALFVAGARGLPGGLRLSPRLAGAAQLLIGVYGGYFGGGIGFLMLATLTLAGLAIKPAQATKNVLAAVMNLSAVLVFVASGLVAWGHALALGSGAVLGGWLGAGLIPRLPDRLLRGFVIAIGLLLSVGLFWRG